MGKLKVTGYEYFKDESTGNRITVTHYSDNKTRVTVSNDHRNYPLYRVPVHAVKVGEWRAVHVTD